VPETVAVTRPPPELPLDLGLGQLGLGRHQVLLHLLGLLQQLLHVRLTTTGHHDTPR
jgi:hypothetical protein